VARSLEIEDLVEHFMLYPGEAELLRNKTGATRLGFAVLHKYFLWKARFPRGRSDVPDNVVEFVAGQLGVPASDMGFYDWDGRQIKRHRVEIRRATGFRECSVADAEKLTALLASGVCLVERRVERVREELLRCCREEKIEPPSGGRVGRIVGSALRQAEQTLMSRVSGRVPVDVAMRMTVLIAEAADVVDVAEGEGDPGAGEVLALIKADPGNVSLKTMQDEVAKLSAVRAIGLPTGLFADVSPKVVNGWRARAAVEAPSHLRAHPEPVKLTLLAALLYCREREITDTLVDLLIATVQRIHARAERKVVEEFVSDLKRVTGKENILFKITEAVVDEPDGIVAGPYPAAGGLGTLIDLLHEYKAKGSSFRQHKQRVFKASYTNHYRHGIIDLTRALEFRSINTVHRPVLQALELIARYDQLTTNATQYYAYGESVPVEGVIPADLMELLYRVDKRGRRRIQRSVYECGVFQSLREKLRCKEIWVVGADKWRNPDEDLPEDFDEQRVAHYAALRKPLEPQRFVDALQEEMHAELRTLNTDLPTLGWLTITDRRAGAITLSALEAVTEPRSLRRLKAAVKARWGTVALLDMLTETALRTGCLDVLTAIGVKENLAPAVLFERLLLLIYAYGTNTGVRAVAAGEHGHSEDDLRYARRRYLTVAGCREIARVIANATFTARQSWLWGEGTLRSHRTPLTSPRMTTTSSPNGTPATGGASAAC
jgi:hypothetical protein